MNSDDESDDPNDYHDAINIVSVETEKNNVIETEIIAFVDISGNTPRKKRQT